MKVTGPDRPVPAPPPSPPTSTLSPATLSAVKHIVAGGLTGALAIFITYPTEFIKTLMQLDEMAKPRKYKGTWHCLVKTVRENGYLHLYRGFPVLLYGSIPKIASRFLIFEFMREELEDERGHLSNAAKLICGLGAGISEAVIAVTPMETVKVKFINDVISSKPQFKGLVHGVKIIVEKEGWRGVYQAPTATVIKQGTNQALRFWAMENLRDLYKGDDRKKKIPKPVVGFMGICAGAVSTLGNTPIDVLKTRMQSFDSHKYKSTWDCAVQIFKNEGLPAFYRGLAPRLVRVCLDVASTSMIHDTLIDLLNKFWPDEV